MLNSRIDLLHALLPSLPLDVLTTQAVLLHNDQPDLYGHHQVHEHHGYDPKFLRQLEMRYLKYTLREDREALITQGLTYDQARQVTAKAIEGVYPHLIGVHHARPAKNAEPPLLSLLALEQRGWTAKMVNQFLNTPEFDFVTHTPLSKHATPRRMYRQRRVREIEVTSEGKKALSRTALQSPRTPRHLPSEDQPVLAYLRQLQIEVPILPHDTLRRLSIAHHNAWSNEKPLSRTPRHEVLNLIILEYLTYLLSDYEVALYRAYGTNGEIEGHHVLMENIIVAISEMYPYMKATVHLQLSQQNADRAAHARTG